MVKAMRTTLTQPFAMRTILGGFDFIFEVKMELLEVLLVSYHPSLGSHQTLTGSYEHIEKWSSIFGA